MRKAVARKQSSQPAAVQRRSRESMSSNGLGFSEPQNGFRSAQHSNVSLTPNDGSSALAQRKLVESLQQSSRAVAQQKKSKSLQCKSDGKLLQEKTDVAQRVEEEELLQGKFETAQLVEEEELLQGKFETAQLVEEEELLQGKFETAQLFEEEEELLQGKFETAQLVDEEETLQGKFEVAQLEEEIAASPNKSGLPDNLKSGIESLSGVSMDGVNVHYNSDKPAQLNAHAYAQGTDIHVGSGQEKHLPHEAWHVAQQAQGRVSPTVETEAGVQINDNESLETEADVMGAKAMQFKLPEGRKKSTN